MSNFAIRTCASIPRLVTVSTVDEMAEFKGNLAQVKVGERAKRASSRPPECTSLLSRARLSRGGLWEPPFSLPSTIGRLAGHSWWCMHYRDARPRCPFSPCLCYHRLTLPLHQRQPTLSQSSQSSETLTLSSSTHRYTSLCLCVCTPCSATVVLFL